MSARTRSLDLAAWVFARMPLWIANLWAWSLAWLWWTVLPVRKAVALDNMAQALPEIEPAQRAGLLRRSVHDLALGYVELLSSLRRPALFETRCSTEGLENLTDRQAKGLPCLVLQGHFGSFDLIMLAMGRGRGMDLSCIVKAPVDPWVAGLVEQARKDRGVDLIPPRHSMDRVYRALDDGRVVIFVNDQRYNEGIPLPFLGRDALTSLGLASAARRSRVPVFLVWQWREGIGRHVMHVSPAIELEWTDDRDEDLARATLAFNQALEVCIRQRPHGWLWLHKRWRR